MKRIIDISEELYNSIKMYSRGSEIENIIEDSTPLNECEAEDCISRKDAHKALQELADSYKDEFMKKNNAVHEAAMGGRMFGATRASEIILELPSVHPKNEKPKLSTNMKCSDCMASGCDMCVLEPTMWQFDSDKVEEQGE